MKKIALMIGALCFVFASCNNTVSTQEESVENPPMEKKCQGHGDRYTQSLQIHSLIIIKGHVRSAYKINSRT